MTPEEAMSHLTTQLAITPNIAVVGIAGPGDPFANPDETLRTFRLVREKYPNIMLCVSTNGLNIFPYIDEIAALRVSHVTITVNAVDPAVGAQSYAWIEIGNEQRRGPEAAKLLWSNQQRAIRKLAARGILVKVNTVYVPGVNSSHIEEISQTVAQLGASVQNVIPLLPTANTAFADIPDPTQEEMKRVREVARKYLPQMEHCSRCRADAVGLLGQRKATETQTEVTKMLAHPQIPNAYVAVASSDGARVNVHLGEADYLLIYYISSSKPKLVGLRRIPPLTTEGSRWTTLATLLHDCQLLLTAGIGPLPKSLLQQHGMQIRTVRGRICDLLEKIDAIKAADDDVPFVCGESCHGGRRGCGCEMA
jgi:nitrogen fixation protein NifB